MKESNVFSSHNSIRLVHNGDDFLNTTIELINEAKDFIWLHTYIYEDDSITKPVTEALIRRAKEGIKIFFLVDGFGSRFLNDDFVTRFKEVGIHFSLFAPMFSKKMYHWGRRLHSKILLIDNSKVLTGGINLSQHFNAPHNKLPWLDYSVLIEGEEVFEITRRNFRLYAKHFPYIKQQPNKFLYVPNKKPESVCLLRTQVNDWMRFKNEIYQGHVEAIRNARDRIIIMATYFFPGKKFLNELRQAASKGVEVILIFTEKSDHPLERWSSKYLYSWFLSHNFKIYEWGESIVHGKLALFDDHWVTVGSYNHNFMSRYGNIELNIDVSDHQFASEVEKEIDYVLGLSTEITKERWQSSYKLSHRIKETLSFIFANFLTVTSFWFAIRKNDKKDFNLLGQ
jgi:cardiolipin synthase